MLGKTEGRKRRGQERMRCLHGIADSVDLSLSSLWEMVKHREARRAAAMQSPRVEHDRATNTPSLLKTYLVFWNNQGNKNKNS